MDILEWKHTVPAQRNESAQKATERRLVDSRGFSTDWYSYQVEAVTRVRRLPRKSGARFIRLFKELVKQQSIDAFIITSLSSHRIIFSLSFD